MSVTRIPICFDVLGTCFSFEAATKALLNVFPKLEGNRADSIIQDWFHSAQRDFTYLSMNDCYKPIAQVLKSTLPRIYLMNSLVPSSPASNGSSSIDSNLLDPIMAAIPKMGPRPGLQSCTRLLHDSSIDFNLLAVTNGGLETTKGYFYNAFSEEGGKEMVEKEFGWSFLSCDEIQCAKPDQKVYENVWKRLKSDHGIEKRQGWFVASHTWDLHAAKRAGFKTAFVTYEEHLVLPELFGRPDIVAKDLEDCAKQIIAYEEGKK
ncbi:uncharacterized protein JCM6883_007218 [Sporobolomyces salmoneus]|uniref:uncharacterized protein n=1 Tax=Sporobolomyces salmoneus TaxID=183962 RepID=UPI003176B5D0